MKKHLLSSNITTIIKATFLVLLLGSFFAVGISIASKHFNTNAISARDFKAGNIIDDSVFYNKDAMSVQQIQNFLNQQIGNCDVWGTGIAREFGSSLTRAQYAASRGWHAPPYPCLNVYHENPNNGQSSYERGGGAFAGGISAAQIIYNAAQQYGINPQVLLVLLKKESGGPLTADTWPLKSQYRYAMGYACPDSGPGNSANCSDAPQGFYKQMDKAAWQLKYYKDNANSYRYKIGWNDIQYSPNVACGTKRVYIENLATLSLYIYTPYTPNDGALANYPGEAHCGAYGNRNFYMFFREWFGDPSYRPPACDSKVAGARCVWRLYDPKNMSEFLTINNSERDAVVRNNSYSYQDIAFYAFASQQPGTVPVYRIRMPQQHFYTTNVNEMNALLQDSRNTREGVAFYVYPGDKGSNTAHAVHRLSHPTRGHKLTAASKAERDNLVKNAGFTYESVPFSTPSGQSTVPTAASGRANIYRLNGSNGYMYTTSLAERDNLIRGKWKYEGVLTHANAANTGTPIYRLHNGRSHLFTSSANERDALVRGGWKNEGTAFRIDTQTPQVFRFYARDRQFLTANVREATQITNRSARFETIAFGRQQDANTPIYRLYNGHYHHYTRSTNELLKIANTGSWRYEGIAWNAPTAGKPIYRLFNGRHLYTGSAAERNALVRAGWRNEGVGWYASENNSGPVYRLYHQGRHFFTASANERDALIRGGWRNEGVGWYNR